MPRFRGAFCYSNDLCPAFAFPAFAFPAFAFPAFAFPAFNAARAGSGSKKESGNCGASYNVSIRTRAATRASSRGRSANSTASAANGNFNGNYLRGSRCFEARSGLMPHPSSSARAMMMAALMASSYGSAVRRSQPAALPR